ncbi:MAG: sulfite exporter TauE/SafE family protein [Acidimicrobiia bacterium]
MDLNITQIVVVAVVVYLGFFGKGVTGMGGPLLTIPVLAGFTGLEFAVAVIGIPTIVANSVMLWDSRGASKGVMRFFWPLLITGTIATVIGAWILVSVDERLMTIVLAAFLILYVLWSVANKDFQLSDEWARRLSAPAGLAAGLLQGGTGASGPVIATFVHSLNLTREAFVFAVCIPFQVLGMTQIISLAAFGAYDRERLIVGAIATIPALLALRPAMKLGERLSHGTFRMLILIFLLITAIRLIWTVV